MSGKPRKINKLVNYQNIIVRSSPAFNRNDFENFCMGKSFPPPREENKIGYNVSVGPPSSSVQTLEERKGDSLKEGRRVPDIDLAFFVAKSLPIFRQLMDFLCIYFEVPYMCIICIITKRSRLCFQLGRHLVAFQEHLSHRLVKHLTGRFVRGNQCSIQIFVYQQVKLCQEHPTSIFGKYLFGRPRI